MANPKGAGKIQTAPNNIRVTRKHIRELFETSPSHKYHVQFVRSLVVSVIALIANFGSSFIFKEVLGIYYLLAATASYCVGVLVNYYLSVVWVFAHRQLESKKAEFIIFAAINTIGLVFNILIIAGLVEITKLNYWIALSIATIIVFFWNFLARKRILY